MTVLPDTDEYEPVTIVRMPYDWLGDDDHVVAFAVRGSKIVGSRLMTERNATNAKTNSVQSFARHVQQLDRKAAS